MRPTVEMISSGRRCGLGHKTTKRPPNAKHTEDATHEIRRKTGDPAWNTVNAPRPTETATDSTKATNPSTRLLAHRRGLPMSWVASRMSGLRLSSSQRVSAPINARMNGSSPHGKASITERPSAATSMTKPTLSLNFFIHTTIALKPKNNAAAAAMSAKKERQVGRTSLLKLLGNHTRPKRPHQTQCGENRGQTQLPRSLHISPRHPRICSSLFPNKAYVPRRQPHRSFQLR